MVVNLDVGGASALDKCICIIQMYSPSHVEDACKKMSQYEFHKAVALAWLGDEISEAVTSRKCKFDSVSVSSSTTTSELQRA